MAMRHLGRIAWAEVSATLDAVEKIAKALGVAATELLVLALN